MRVRSRRAAAILAAACWIAVAAFCAAGFAGSGLTPNMDRFFAVVLAVAMVLTVTAVVGYVITPVMASYGIGVRAGLRAGRDGAPRGKHARQEPGSDAKIYDFQARR